MRTETPNPIYLKDYRSFPYAVESLSLDFDLCEGETVVTSRADYVRKGEAADVYLYGEDLELLSIEIDGQAINDYSKDEAGLTIPCPKSEKFTLEIKTKIYPEKNTRLEGLYRSGENYCTQCEAEGFRRITYYPDRPDVLTVFTVRIEADADKYPVLLSNGNRQEEGALEGGRHYALWHDPFPKPCYLFALVAGDLAHIHDRFTTKSGRDVDLYIYVRPGDEPQCAHAMESLKKAMKWDEDTYGLEYDLDLFNIVAVSDFNMGAMENTSLNIFNTALVLAGKETATDADFMRVEGVIAHEYFHNWSGNRVTCRDWFQLSLKEGLTVFRDQEFSSDMNARDVQRIDDVTQLRRLQFPEDAGPLAHPIRPDNYIEINNFYTMTVYEKGAEVIRMMRTLLGAENYRKGTDLYFSRHDGQAVTCEDFVACMEEAGGMDLSQFRLWYSQAGTPEVRFRGEYDAAKKTYSVELSQSIPDTPGQTGKKPMHIPVAVGFLTPPVIPTDRQGVEESEVVSDPSTNARDDTVLLHLTKAKQSYIFEGFETKPVPSILRGFSAPVKLSADLSNADLSFLMLHDTDGFNRWEAGQQLSLRMINHLTDAIEKGEKPEICPRYMEGIGALLEQVGDDAADKALMARALILPSVTYAGQSREIIDPVALHDARETIIRAVKRAYKPLLQKLYEANRAQGAFSIAPEAMGRRALRNALLSFLTGTNGTGCAKLAKAQYDEADNMTDRVAALARLADNPNAQRDEAFEDFYARFRDYPLVVDKWFALQAGGVRKDLIDHLKKLQQHHDFNIKNPNRVRSLYAAFAMNNPVGFHAADGSGYEFLCDAIVELNGINPQIAARLLTPMREWRRYTPDRQAAMKAGLERILAVPGLAPDVFEIATKSLNA